MNGTEVFSQGLCLRAAHRPIERLDQDMIKGSLEEGDRRRSVSLVDGLTGQPTVSVDGLPFERYAVPLRQLATFLSGH